MGFAESYKNLNDEQKQAVDIIDGPLLVIAGPGTGKTELLSSRVANILLQTDVSASSILCLTFTNFAATNMRKRLVKIIGPDAARVKVNTFHSFAADIMSEYSDYFWNGARLTTAPDAVQTDIISSILRTMPLDNPLATKFAGQYTAIKNVQNSLKLVKEAGLTPEKLEAIIKANLAFIDVIEPELVKILSAPLSYKKLGDVERAMTELPVQKIDDLINPLVSLSTAIQETFEDAKNKDQGTNKTKHTGEWKKRFLQSEAGVKAMHKQRKANDWWLELSHVYSLYRNELHNRGHYDYADMLVEVIAQAEQNPSLLSDIQERYQYVLIDEFQDSNAAQMRLAHLVSSHPINEGKPNLMVVGDDDQSIYKFNGAELSNMLGFRRTYPSAKIVVLTKNYRSTQAILDTSKHVIEQVEDRLTHHEVDINKNLEAVATPTHIGEVRHDSYITVQDQYFYVSQDIQKRREQNQTIAVLARSHESLQTIAAELLRLEVPIQYEKQNNILEYDATKQILLLCELIQAIAVGDELTLNNTICQILGHPVWGLDARTLWQLAITNRYNPHWLDSLLDHENASFQAFGEWLLWLSTTSKTCQLALLLDYILGLRASENFTSPFKKYYLDLRKLQSEYLQTLSAVQRLRGVVQECTGKNQPTLADFVAVIKVHDENSLPISDQSLFVNAPDAVQLLSVHKAKGLEFDIVYIIDSVEGQWKPRNKGRLTPANLPLQPYGDDYDDYARLMFVAMTRAKHTLILNSYRYNDSGEDVMASPLIADVHPVHEHTEQTTEQSIRVLESQLSWPEISTQDEKMLLLPLVQVFSLNVTELMNFLDITKGGPQLFLQRNLLHLPGARTISLAFGTAIHSALEQAQRRVNSGDFDKEHIKAYFATELQKEPILPEELNRWLKKGTHLLDNLFDNHILVLPEGGLPEQKLQNIDLNGAVIEGKLDHITKDGSELLITDYKTGAPLTSFYSKAKNIQEKIWKHKTQLIFYALLAKHHPDYKSTHVTCQMLYLEAEQAKDFAKIYTPTPEEIDRLENLVRAVYTKIMDYNLPDISAYSPDFNGIQKFENDLISGNI